MALLRVDKGKRVKERKTEKEEGSIRLQSFASFRSLNSFHG